LQQPVADTLVYEGDGSALSYEARHLGPAAPVASTQEFEKVLVDRLNQVRQGAHLPALLVAPAQSRENARLVGTLIDSAFGGDAGAGDRAALGLLAGWKVPGLVRDGSFFVGAVAPTRDVNAWLDYALERPIGRVALLDPQARRIAIGPAVPEGVQALGAVVTTYALFESGDHTEDEARFFERIAAARKARGLAAPVRYAATEGVRAECERVRTENKAPMTALHEMMQDVVTRTGSSVMGYVLETNDLDDTDVPDPLLRAGPLNTVLAITHHRAEGAAWGQYVIFAVLLGTTGTISQQAVGGIVGRRF
jgi:hypothetical protein